MANTSPAAAPRNCTRRQAFVRRALLVPAGLLCVWLIWTRIPTRAPFDDLSFLGTQAGFLIGQSLIEYRPTDTIAWALTVGLTNTLLVSALSLMAATVLGFLAGVAQMSDNPAIRLLATSYVGLLRSVPLLLWLFFWYSLLLVQLPPARSAVELLPHLFLSNEGISFPSINSGWGLAMLAAGMSSIVLALAIRRVAAAPASAKRLLVAIGTAAVLTACFQPDFTVVFPTKTKFRIEGGLRVTTEFAALLLGLSLSASSAIAEIVRAGFRAVPPGQVDASRALGLSWVQSMRLVVLPQAIKAITPPLTNTYASLAKASSLAVAIGFPDLVMVANTIINQTGRALECTAIYTLSYLLISLGISSLTQNLVGQRDWTSRV